MPIFNYYCLKCTKHFERILKHSEADVKQDCPECASLETEKLLSVFGNYTINGNNSASTRPKGVAGRNRK